MRIHRRCWIPAVALLLPVLAAPAWAEEEEESVKVYRALQPSVVGIKNMEGSGTGILLNEQGMVLTNAHVVASEMPQTVQIDAVENGKTVARVFRKVTIVGFHPKYDLALLQINPKEHNITLAPATLAAGKPIAGQRVYAIGNPGGGGQILDKTITSGMLSSTDREIEKLTYYQFSAPINHGNSGGPLVDKSGKVLGVVTFKMSGTEALGFAIPVANLDLKAFVPLAKRPADPVQAKKHLDEAARAMEAARQIAKEEGGKGYAKNFQYYAAMCFRRAIASDPSNARAYYSLGAALRSVDVNEPAAAYLIRNIQMAPWEDAEALPYHELGLAYAQAKKDKEALVAWNEGLAKVPTAARIWEDLAIFHLDRKNYAEAVKSAAGALMTADRKTRASTMNKILVEARNNLSGDALAKANTLSADAAVIADLRQRDMAAEAAFKARKLYVTAAFASLVGEHGGNEWPDAAKNIGKTPRMSRVPTSRPATVSVEQLSPEEALAERTRLMTAYLRKSDNAVRMLPAALSAPGIAVVAAPTTKAATAPSTKPADDEEDWIGEKLLQVERVNNDLSHPAQTVNGLTLARTRLPVMPRRGNSVFWIGDGSAFVAADGKGVLHHVMYPSLREDRTVHMGPRVSLPAQTRNALIVTAPETNQVYQVDPSSLEVTHRYEVESPLLPAASVNQPIVYFSDAQNPLVLHVLNTSTHQFAGRVDLEVVRMAQGARSRAPAGWGNLTLSPDGKGLISYFQGHMHRLTIENDFYRLDEESVGPVPQVPPVWTYSTDSRYIARGNVVFKSTSLTKPAMELGGAENSRVTVLDKASGLVFASPAGKDGISVFSGNGKLLAEITLPIRPVEVTQIAPHPKGRSLLVVASGEVFSIQLPVKLLQPK